ncbi:MAG: GTPase HflX [Candidatus Latescibacteria bacterium]|nr:GTPase HflX [Candidatus Latescibacterota bacterium]
MEANHTLHQERAILVGVALPKMPAWEAEHSLDELGRLVATAGLVEAARQIQGRDRIDPAHYVGKGKAASLKQLAAQCQADVIVFDNDLSPAQMRNLESITKLRIIDRSAVILDIFARHARTHTAQIQVELAQLNYLLPRLTRYWTHLSRQAGGGAIRGMGAAGVRGPGGLIRRQINSLEAKLDKIGVQMATNRKNRADVFKVALVGYTNAGKSTLMKRLSGADVLVEDQLFATLDSTTRAVDLDRNHKILLTDTVGFINRLPHHLFASFRATLEEAVEADLLLHVIDLSFPYYESQIATVEQVLHNLGLADSPTLRVYNKIDQVAPGEEERIAAAYADREDAIAVSASQAINLDALRDKIRAYSVAGDITLELQVPQAEGRLLAHLHQQGQVLAETYKGNDVCLCVRLEKTWAKRWRLERFVPPSPTEAG